MVPFFRRTPRTCPGWAVPAIVGTLIGLLGVPSPVLGGELEPNFPPPDPDAVSFSDETVRLDSIGLRIGVPTGGDANVQQLAGKPTVVVDLPGGLGTVMVQSRETRGTPLSVLDLEKAILRRALFRSLSDERIELTIDLEVETNAGFGLGRSPAIPAAGRIVRPFYVRLRADDADQPMRGFSVVQLEPEVFVLFQLFCNDESFEDAREAYELVVMSASLKEGAALDEERAEHVASGETFLQTLTQDDLTAVVTDTPDEFQRIYRPAPGGAAADEEEVGYRRIRAWMGTADDVETGEASESVEPDGYVLRIDGAALLDDGFGNTSRADSRAVHYLSMDRRRESWKVEMSIREAGKRKPEVWTEVGFRLGDSMSVQVTHLNEKGRSSTIRPSIQGEAYISRVESHLMPAILIHKGVSGTFSFYAYDQAAEVNRLRTVSIQKAADRPGLWDVTTRLPGDQQEDAVFTGYGRLVGAKTSEGVAKRPIEFERLFELWRSKKLPLD